VKRLALEARNDAKRRHFQDEAGPSDLERRMIMERKAKKYEAMRKGDLSGFTEKELEESVIDVSGCTRLYVKIIELRQSTL
jgi:hypothetical protein